ncbi:hypothetical protein V6N11_047416 [Hibiscus sabdariffa]|uniref:Uncharacterized protein n=1 Tax=Hibiscus sabdariffa TaxID=183260 RepID=A0ABR2A4R8_9ROSI
MPPTRVILVLVETGGSKRAQWRQQTLMKPKRSTFPTTRGQQRQKVGFTRNAKGNEINLPQNIHLMLDMFTFTEAVACLQAQLMQVKGQVAENNAVNSWHNTEENQWQGNYIYGLPSIPSYPISPQSSLESVELNNGKSMNLQETQSRDEFCNLNFPKKTSYNNDDLGELQALALRMMRN